MGFGVEGSLNYGILMGRERFVLTPYLQTRAYTERDHRLGVRFQGIAQSTQRLELDLVVLRLNELLDTTDTWLQISARLRL